MISNASKREKPAEFTLGEHDDTREGHLANFYANPFLQVTFFFFLAMGKGIFQTKVLYNPKFGNFILWYIFICLWVSYIFSFQ